MLVTPITFNITRYIDNDRDLLPTLNGRYHLPSCKPYVYECKKLETGYEFEAVLAANCLMPSVHFTIKYEVVKNELQITINYKIADYIQNLPRFGLEFAIAKSYNKFAYIGYGPTESYIDKHVATEYGYYESTAEENYDMNYIRPQESGSHYATKFLNINNAFSLTADKNFSFSVNPYTTKQLRECLHTFELQENNFVNVCIDLAMRGLGSKSCGPDLANEYEIPREFSNKFYFKF